METCGAELRIYRLKATVRYNVSGGRTGSSVAIAPQDGRAW